jgi:hypothetical protein
MRSPPGSTRSQPGGCGCSPSPARSGRRRWPACTRCCCASRSGRPGGAVRGCRGLYLAWGAEGLRRNHSIIDADGESRGPVSPPRRKPRPAALRSPRRTGPRRASAPRCRGSAGGRQPFMNSPQCRDQNSHWRQERLRSLRRASNIILEIAPPREPSPATRASSRTSLSTITTTTRRCRGGGRCPRRGTARWTELHASSPPAPGRPRHSFVIPSRSRRRKIPAAADANQG